ncbi:MULTISPECIES: FeoB-associated Cys-rich membrane protein [Megasphaera]|uniref:FeoB-associated Cys-rich membrane protein n=1 Tax=Megasphaera hutchinsoni TaxID=1588748 RepID=A0A134CIG5_9FIRM|nr:MULTISPECIES: FeoB-associated Cys-rich membrane protein [Megasphaera]MUP48248.1 FeoB-associated Cys-rich membrane protein [Veillonellaceae bacterium M2-8]MUP59411.1 FeoB-associated Cys-rich membrane protein [Veillonellaceae bacterium M2-4]EGS35712.1 hypothetical protein HMPREF1040_0122 [Megasphaera sp. UPII 135-E]KXB91917.1 hypothetical protein HMPREF3182_00656 [Megasphaera hutchinsoni]PNH21739.1 FeoB-associated Cys-rich membrane protein [Megasphaera genomosp. type_2]
MANIIVGIIVLAVIVGAARSVYKKRNSCSCGCGSDCGTNCHH